METDISQAFQKELTCFICLSCLTEPVTISCGHSFCRACLHLSWEDIQLPVQCPMCREPSQKDLRTNIVLKKLVSITRQTSLMKDLSSEEHKCTMHKETKRIFCTENRIFLCQLCSHSHEHRGHRHCPIEAASESQMERLVKQMASLWRKIQENQEDYLTLREQMIRTEYTKLHPLLCEEEVQHIESMRNEGQYVLEKLRTSVAIMIQKSKEIREMYQELMAMSQEPYVVLLQDLDDMFRRFSFRLHHKDTPADSAGFYFASWGSQSFISGKYYWEIDLKDSCEWAVGVCKNSQLRSRNQMIESEGAFLLVCVKEGNHYSLLTICPVIRHYIEKPLGQVGVLLDCEDGCLSFLNVTKSSLIYRYPPGTFNYPVRPCISSGHTWS
ncbi:tripartite motif-containing protein 43B-like [Peromyscus eremicus]|uniref:tripartite motif-containing protein 43B-like n=1 Tax=Peromyscus eremicus TaxID=42410 RepID=UPI0027DC1160|nr:tripartite motif-containing protein 43B-like [Peromyscus eremicus]